MVCRFVTMITIVGLAAVLAASVAYAGGGNESAPFYIGSRDDAEYGRTVVIEGEILGVCERQIRVCSGGEQRVLAIGERPAITMNGRPALLQALRPVADDCYFIGRVWLDRTGMVRRIEGEYRGAAVRILEASRLENGGVRLVVENTEEEGEPRRQFETIPDCRGIDSALAGREQAEAFILFDLHGKVRGVFF